MLFDWFGQAEKTPPADRRYQPLRAKPQLEALEERFMPGAVRAIAGSMANSLPHEDDAPSPQANIGFTINFFGSQFSQVFVNNNGNITFGQAFPTFTPTALNSGNGGIPIIAPFFADVDTRVGPVVTYGQGTLCGLKVFTVNYLNVGYFDEHLDKTDSFQVVLIDRSDVGAGDFDIEFNYNNIQWETGDASGGTNGLGGESAAVGFSNGTGNAGTFFELPGSHVNGAFINGGPDALVDGTMMASTPGRFHFLVRNGNVMMAKVNNDVTDSTRLFYPFRYTEDPQTHVETGNLTVININTATGLAACLDETGGSNVLPGPINVVFTNIPSNIQLINPTGFTASGDPFITINVAALPPNECARAQIQILPTPTPTPTTTFAQGFSARVFSGPFDPTML
jgi:hypothetical protein